MTRSLLLLLALLLALTAPVSAKLKSKEIKSLKAAISKGHKDEDWDAVASGVKALSADNTKRTWSYLLKVAEAADTSTTVLLAFQAASTSMDGKGIDKAARKALERSRSPGVRRALLHAFAERKDWEAVSTRLKDDDENVVYAAIWTLSRSKAESAVEPLIELMKRLEKGKSTNFIEVRTALTHLLGQRLNSGTEYASLWETVKSQGGLSAVKPYDPSKDKGAGGTRTLSFFGESIEASRVVFILDVSGSMSARYKGTRNTGLTPESKDSGSVTKKDGANPNNAAAARQTTRLRAAKDQLKKVLAGIDGRVRVNVLIFSSVNKIRLWREGDEKTPPTVHPLTKENRASAIEFVENVRASGATATDLALTKAYTIKGARAFYLLSDGAPTQPKGGQALPVEEVYKVVRKHDRGRGITLHTMGFRGADPTMMEGLASMTRGRFTQIE